MREYKNQAELNEAIGQSYQKFIAEFQNIPEELRDKRIPEVDKTPTEMLAYQLGWLTLVLSWEREEQAGKEVITPTAEYKWNNLGGLYHSFYQQFGNQTLKQQEQEVNVLLDEMYGWIAKLTSQELFESGQRKWATTKAQWPLWKWIHINTVAPFTNFRPKIRKWKKLVL